MIDMLVVLQTLKRMSVLIQINFIVKDYQKNLNIISVYIMLIN